MNFGFKELQMKNVYEKYLSNDDLRQRSISKSKILYAIMQILWLSHLIFILFFSDKVDMSSQHELVLFVILSVSVALSVVKYEVLCIVDLIKKTTKKND